MSNIKRSRTASSHISVACVEHIMASWLQTVVEEGGKRDLVALLKPIEEQMTWKTTVPSIDILMKTSGLVRKFVIHAPNLLIKPALMQGGLMNLHSHLPCLPDVEASQVLFKIEHCAGLIRCAITRWRELVLYPPRLTSVLTRASHEQGQTIASVCDCIRPLDGVATSPGSPDDEASHRRQDSKLVLESPRRVDSTLLRASPSAQSLQDPDQHAIIPYVAPPAAAPRQAEAYVAFNSASAVLDSVFAKVRGGSNAKTSRAHASFAGNWTRSAIVSSNLTDIDAAIALQVPLPAGHHGISKSVAKGKLGNKKPKPVPRPAPPRGRRDVSEVSGPGLASDAKKELHRRKSTAYKKGYKDHFAVHGDRDAAKAAARIAHGLIK